jgi:hypothetical protein
VPLRDNFFLSRIESRINPSLTNRVLESITWFTKLNKASPLNEIEIVDLGCGTGRYWQDVLNQLPQNLSVHLTLVDVEQFHAEMTDFNSDNLESLFIVQSNLDSFEFTWQRENSMKLVCSFEVLEHLSKHEGWTLLYKIDSLLVGQRFGMSLVSSPRGFIYQPPSLDNVHNAHISEWDKRDLRKAGYQKIQGLTRTSISFLNFVMERQAGTPVGFLSFIISAVLTRVGYSLAYEFFARKVKFIQQGYFVGTSTTSVQED